MPSQPSRWSWSMWFTAEAIPNPSGENGGIGRIARKPAVRTDKYLNK